MRDFGDQILDTLPDDYLPAAARLFAEIQLDSVADLQRWAQLGCPNRGPEAMINLMDQLLIDPLASQVGRFALNEAELEELQAFMPQLKAMWTRLMDYALPLTIHQQDFRGGNIALVGQTYLYYDWSDTVIAHPFFSVHRMLDFLPAPAGLERWQGHFTHPDDQTRRNIRAAYLEPWTAYEPMERLLEAFILSRYLNEVYQAVRWYLELAHLEPGSPWTIEVATEGSPWHLKQVLKVKSFLQETNDA
jgi:hypothetical protein